MGIATRYPHMGFHKAEMTDSHLDGSEDSLGQSSLGLVGRQPFLINLYLAKMLEWKVWSEA